MSQYEVFLSRVKWKKAEPYIISYQCKNKGL